MSDIKRGLERDLAHFPPPDLWVEIEARGLEGERPISTGPIARFPLGRRLVAAVTALVIALMAGAILWRAVVGSGRRPADTPTPTPPPAKIDACTDAVPCRFDGGSYVTDGTFAFMPGLSFVGPKGWEASEDAAGSLALRPIGLPFDRMLFWVDVVPQDANGKPVLTVASTPEALTTWLSEQPGLIVSKPQAVTIGAGIPAISVVVDVDPTARNDFAGCLSAVCKNTLVDPVHWPDGGTGPERDPDGSGIVYRYYFAMVGRAPNRHLLAIALEANADHPLGELRRFTLFARPVLESIRPPDVVGVR